MGCYDVWTLSYEGWLDGWFKLDEWVSVRNHRGMEEPVRAYGVVGIQSMRDLIVLL